MKNLMWKQLRRMGFTPEQLRRIQSDKNQWIQRGAITLSDLTDTTIFPINPIRDMHADIGEVWSMKLNLEQMKSMDITYEDLIRKGMTLEIMSHFNLCLSSWVMLGFKEKHILPGPMSRHVFGVEEEELRKILPDYS